MVAYFYKTCMQEEIREECASQYNVGGNLPSSVVFRSVFRLWSAFHTEVDNDSGAHFSQHN